MLRDLVPVIPALTLDPDVADVKIVLFRIRRRERYIRFTETCCRYVQALEIHGGLPGDAAVPGKSDAVAGAVILSDTNLLA